MDRNAKIIALRQEGVGPREIARRLGISPNVVAGVLHRAGLSHAQRALYAYPEEFRARAVAYAAHLTQEAAAAEFGVSQSVVSQWARA